MHSITSRRSSGILPAALVFFQLASAAFAQSSTPPTTPQNPVPATTQPAPGPTSPSMNAGQTPSPNPPAQQQNASPQAAQPQGVDQNNGQGDDQSMFVFKKQVEEVVLHATVVDQQRNIIPSLDKSAFTVSESGKPQTITSFRREDVPVAIGVVVDNSGSMRDKREKIARAVMNLIRVSNPKDQVFVVNFNDNPYLDQDFTSDVNLLQVALRRTSTRGSTALYDAVVASAKHLDKDSALEKKVLLVITDGQDNMSQETLQEATRRLQQANGPVLYAVGLAGGGMDSQGRAALQRLAEGTGGVAYFLDTLDQVDELTRTIAHDIRSQYMIAYRPQNQNARPQYQSLQVNAQAPGYGKLTVRTRSGYYPPAK